MIIENFEQFLNNFFQWIDRTVTTDTPTTIEFTYKGYSDEDTLVRVGISKEAYSKFQNYSKEKIRNIIERRFKDRHGHANRIRILRMEPAIIPNFGKEGDCFLICKIFYEYEEEKEKLGKMVFYLFSHDEMWAGLEIKDPYGYFQKIFDEIERGIMGGSYWNQIKDDLDVNEETIKRLVERVRGYSKNEVCSLIRERLEEKYGINPEIIVEFVGMGIEVWPRTKTDIYILLVLEWSVNTEREVGIDAPVMELEIFSKDDVRVRWK
jgi:hypothetical protein